MELGQSSGRQIGSSRGSSEEGSAGVGTGRSRRRRLTRGCQRGGGGGKRDEGGSCFGKEALAKEDWGEGIQGGRSRVEEQREVLQWRKGLLRRGLGQKSKEGVVLERGVEANITEEERGCGRGDDGHGVRREWNCGLGLLEMRVLRSAKGGCYGGIVEGERSAWAAATMRGRNGELYWWSSGLELGEGSNQLGLC